MNALTARRPEVLAKVYANYRGATRGLCSLETPLWKGNHAFLRKNSLPFSKASVGVSHYSTYNDGFPMQKKSDNSFAHVGISNNRITRPRRTRGVIRVAQHGHQDAIHLKAVHAAQTIDTVKVLSKVFGHSTPHVFGKTGVFVQLPYSERNSTRTDSFVAIFKFGSVVMFNVPPREAGTLLKKIKDVGASEPVSSGFERKEFFEVVTDPTLEEMSHVVNGSFCVVPKLDLNCVAVVGTIMGQTVALDSYNDTVDELLSNFARINSTVTQTGNFTEMAKSKLFRVVSMNNKILIDMVSKLGIKDRSDTAWNLVQYERVHQEMKEEFEIEHRVQNIEFKLDLIQQNAKFFLEIMHNQKSNSLEWIIVVLIGFECVLMCLEMSGVGASLLTLV